MAGNDQQGHHSPSQIAAAARGGHGDGQQEHGGRSPSAIAAAHSGVHGPQAGQEHGIQGGLLGISPSQIADNALRGVVNDVAVMVSGHTLSNDQKEPGLKEVEWGERRDGKGWAEVIREEREKNNQDGGGGGQPPQRGRTQPEEQKQGEKEQERDKGRSLMDSVREWVHEHEQEHGMGCGY